MTVFRDVQNLLLSHGSNFIGEEEFLILYNLLEPRNPNFPHEAYAKFDLDEMAESESLTEVRVRKRDIISLAEVLEIPKQHGSSTRTSRHIAMPWSLSIKKRP